MPLLSVEHRVQEKPTGCLAACVQMVLNYLQDQRTQTELNRAMGLTSLGIPFSRIDALEQFGYTVKLAFGEEDQIQHEVMQGNPVIVPVLTDELRSYWDSTSTVQHAVLVVGCDESFVYINDPVFPDAPKQVSWLEFLLAREEFNHAYAIIHR